MFYLEADNELSAYVLTLWSWFVTPVTENYCTLRVFRTPYGSRLNTLSFILLISSSLVITNTICRFFVNFYRKRSVSDV